MHGARRITGLHEMKIRGECAIQARSILRQLSPDSSPAFAKSAVVLECTADAMSRALFFRKGVGGEDQAPAAVALSAGEHVEESALTPCSSHCFGESAIDSRMSKQSRMLLHQVERVL